MKEEEKDPLWKLLGQAKTEEVSPFFARNVLRAVRNEKQETHADFLGWLSSRWRYACALGAAMAAILLAVSINTLPSRHANVANVQQIAENPDYEVIADLDILLASESDSLWLENSAAF